METVHGSKLAVAAVAYFVTIVSYRREMFINLVPGPNVL